MPGWLQAWVKINPITHLTEACRGLLLGGEVATPVLQSILSATVIMAIFAPLAVRTYRSRT